MKKMHHFFYLSLLFLMAGNVATAQGIKNPSSNQEQVDYRIDNMGYWQRCAAKGLVPVAPFTRIPAAIHTGSKLLTRGLSVIDSPDVCITTEPSNSTQSENSIVVNPNDKSMLLNSNNSTPQPSTGSVKGADALKSLDAGETWTGTVEGAGGSNSGDPAAVIDLNGRYFIGYIDGASGQSVSYSDNNGATWTVAKVGNKPSGYGNMLDKNHLWVDISPTSTFKGYLYDGWTSFGGANNNQVEVSRSITNGASWEAPIKVSGGVNALSHCQGVNLKTGPNGEAYAAFAVYDNGSVLAESAVGFARSLDGGITWQPAIRALNNIKGIRAVGVTQSMRVNSFPSMAVDLSNSANRGTIYIVWSNVGVPGINVGPGCDIYMIKSTDQGVTWSAPIKVNTDVSPGKQHYFPWITVDQANGTISIVSYDNRNCTSNQAEAWMAWSMDGGTTFQDMKVSDVTFTPSPIPMMASNYMGDYLGIAAFGGKTFPCWTDTRSGHCLTYVSPIDLIIPKSLVINTGYILNDTTFGNGNGLMDYGETELVGLKMKNTGNDAADSVTVHLSCDNPYITLQDSVLYYGRFEIGQEKTIVDGFKFSVSDSIPDNEWIMFTVKAIDKNDSITYSTFQIMSHAPDVALLSMVILDPLGNNNGRLDPGEHATIHIETKNNSIWDAENVVSNLSSLNPYVTIITGTANIGTLHAGETIFTSFEVVVNPTAAIGSAALFRDLTVSKYKATDKYYTAKIGLIVEDWETGTMTKFPWEFTNPAKPWTIDPVTKYEGHYSARSAVITHNESTGLSIHYNVMLDDSISFFRRVSALPLFDVLKFYIDDQMMAKYSGFTDTTFKRNVYPVLAGPHIFKWVYEKDQAGSGGLDAAWVDYIVFPPQYRTTVSAGENGAVCAGNDYSLNGLAVNYDSLRWTTSGTGIFSNPFILNPSYTPSASDITAGSVSLTLTAFGQNSTDTTSTMLLNIQTPPTAQAGSDASVCKGLAYPLDEATASHYNSLQWQTKGDGTFDQPSTLHPVYSPGTQDIQTGSVTLVLNAIAGESCQPARDSLDLTIHAVPVVMLVSDTALCANQSITLDATTPDAVSYHWSPSNKTTPTLLVDSTGIGLNHQKIGVVVTDNYGCTGKDSVTVTFKVCGGIGEIAGLRVQIYPNPAKGIVMIEMNTVKQQIIGIHVMNANGESVFTQQDITISGTHTQKLNLTDLPQGTYFVEISNGSGKLVRKLIIQH